MSNVLLVVNDKTSLSVDDTAVKNRLETTLTHTVTLASAAETAETVSAGKDIVVFGPSAGSSTIGNAYVDIAKPMLIPFNSSTTMIPAFKLCGSIVSTTAGRLTAVATGDAILGGLTGLFYVFSTNVSPVVMTRTANAASGMVLVAGVSTSTTNIGLMRCVSGAQLTDRLAAAARVAMPLVNGQIDPANTIYADANLWTIFDASMAWLVTQLSSTPTPPTVDTGADRFAAEGDAVTIAATVTQGSAAVTTLAWTQTSGPTLSLSGTSTDEVSFTVPTGASSTYVLRLTATQSDGGTSFDEITVKGVQLSTMVAPSSAGGTNWTNAGGAASITAALGDASDTTKATSPNNPSQAMLAARIGTGSTAVDLEAVNVRLVSETGTTQCDATIELVEGTSASTDESIYGGGGTVRASYSAPGVTATARNYPYIFSSDERLSISDGRYLWVRVKMTAS